MQYCNWQLLYALKLMMAFECTITIDNVCMHYCNLRQLMYVPLLLTTFVCTILVYNFCMHYCYWQLLYTYLHYGIFVWNSAIQENLCMYYFLYLFHHFKLDKQVNYVSFSKIFPDLEFWRVSLSARNNICQKRFQTTNNLELLNSNFQPPNSNLKPTTKKL